MGGFSIFFTPTLLIKFRSDTSFSCPSIWNLHHSGKFFKIFQSSNPVLIYPIICDWYLWALFFPWSSFNFLGFVNIRLIQSSLESNPTFMYFIFEYVSIPLCFFWTQEKKRYHTKQFYLFQRFYIKNANISQLLFEHIGEELYILSVYVHCILYWNSGAGNHFQFPTAFYRDVSLERDIPQNFLAWRYEYNFLSLCFSGFLRFLSK